jgi:hypothetical protein
MYSTPIMGLAQLGRDPPAGCTTLLRQAASTTAAVVATIERATTQRPNRTVMKSLMTREVKEAVDSLLAERARTRPPDGAIHAWLTPGVVSNGLSARAIKVAPSSEEQYDVAVRQYFEFCLLSRESRWTDPFMIDFNSEDKLLWIACWLQWQMKNGSNIDNSCSGLRHFLLKLGLDVSFFDDPQLKRVRESVRLSADELIAKRRLNMKSPIPIQMLWSIMRDLGSRQNDTRPEFERVKLLGLVALIMYEYGYGLRISNLASSHGRCTHTMRCEAVIFFFTDHLNPLSHDKGFYAYERGLAPREHLMLCPVLARITDVNPHQR